jgi:hypothetical protein
LATIEGARLATGRSARKPEVGAFGVEALTGSSCRRKRRDRVARRPRDAVNCQREALPAELSANCEL